MSVVGPLVATVEADGDDLDNALNSTRVRIKSIYEVYTVTFMYF